MSHSAASNARKVCTFLKVDADSHKEARINAVVDWLITLSKQIVTILPKPAQTLLLSRGGGQMASSRGAGGSSGQVQVGGHEACATYEVSVFPSMQHRVP